MTVGWVALAQRFRLENKLQAGLGPLLMTSAILILSACQPILSPTASTPAITDPTVTTHPTLAPSPPGPVTPSPTSRLSSPTPQPLPPTPQFPFPVAPLPLSAFPRPPDDNGLGVHWSTSLEQQSAEATSYFVSELTRMNIKWVKLLNKGTTGRDYDHTIDELVSRDIMPMLRIYQRCNTPYDPDELEALVRHYVAKGVYYYDLYNEPNLPGESGGWCQPGGEPQPAYLAEVWANAARVIYQAGGYPGLPSFFAPSQNREGWHEDFFYRFFESLRQQGNEDVLYFSWASIHNYHLNHPPTYPYEEVNLTDRPLTEEEIARYDLTEAQVAHINEARAIAQEPRGYNLYDDTSNFFHFIAYRNQFYDLFGFEIPMISTEGGATRGSGEDPRYPVVDGQTVAEWTSWTADYMLDDAPDYYFATMTWLLAQQALDYDDATWEVNAWYHDREGDHEPVVDALKNRVRLNEARRLCTDDDQACWADKVRPQPGKNPLTTYPRPRDDNGRGVHGSPTTQPLPPEVVDYFVPELRAMNIKWVKLLHDDRPEVTDPYLLEQLVANDIEPVIRVYKPVNKPYQNLAELVTRAVPMGVNYFELYNEPNVAGPAGGWHKGEPINVERIVDVWILAAHEVQAAGGHPSLPALAGGGSVDDLSFMRQFLDSVRARGQADLLPGAWIAVHNYFPNPPPDYPTVRVNGHDELLTEAEIAERGLAPGQVEAFANMFYRRFGYYLPVIGTEGGAMIGASQDPCYPPAREEDLTRLTMEAYHAILDDAPAYFFSHMPWLLAASAGEQFDGRLEQAAWYKDRQGTVLPVVEALKADSRKDEVRSTQMDQTHTRKPRVTERKGSP